MIELNQRAATERAATTTVTLAIEQRVKSRLRVTLDDGREAGIFLDRGDSLNHGDKLCADDGTVVMVQAAEESLSVVRCEDALLFARAAYHLGNRHVPVQITLTDNTGEISYLHDHVLDDMLRGLALEVTHTQAPFNPEQGAYGGGHHHHHH